jgi:hypothetical protein
MREFYPLRIFATGSGLNMNRMCIVP